jgi:uncharacterized glyoxalase superfamily metalloenzyme YdcJ
MSASEPTTPARPFASLSNLVIGAAEVAKAAEAGHSSPATESIFRAIALTEEEQTRHELARKAAEQFAAIALTVSDIGLGVLSRIFGVPVSGA